MHDAIIAERAGVPAVAVMTTNFVSAAELMSRVLGMPDYDFAVIDHPVSSATDEGLKAQARKTIDALQRIVMSK
ncbi:MAG: hypothetical protein OSB58_22295 [Alphaproteobacteria bacterium]|nr:hypothetical protein [Alphaproteobacteria bacterium]